MFDADPDPHWHKKQCRSDLFLKKKIICNSGKLRIRMAVFFVKVAYIRISFKYFSNFKLIQGEIIVLKNINDSEDFRLF